MRWINILCMVSIAGCSGITIRIDPFPVEKPVKTLRVAHRIHHLPAPTPTATAVPRHPLQLEPTEHPTPIIKLPETAAWGLSTDPMI